MNLRQRLAAAVKGAFAGWSGPGTASQWPMFRWFQPTNAKINVNVESAHTLSTVWACISLRADLVGQAQPGLFKRVVDANGRAVVTQVLDHPVARLLQFGFTADLSTALALYASQAQVDSWGNSYQEIVRETNGEPSSLHFLDTTATNPVIDRDGAFDVISHYETTHNGRRREIAPEDIVHVRGHTLNGLEGVSVITFAREAIGLALAEEKFGSKYFANDSKSGGYIIQPAETNARNKRARQDNVSAGDEDGMGGQGGPDNAHKPKILDPGVKFIPTTIPPNDAQFLESRAFQVSEVARFYRTPEVLLNSAAATSWGAGIEELKIGFVDMTVRPITTRHSDELSRKLLTPTERAAGLFVSLNVERLLRGNAQAQSEADTKDIQSGVVLRNEVRASRGLNPYEGGDIPLIAVNLADGRKPPVAAADAKPTPEGNDDEQNPPSE